MLGEYRNEREIREFLDYLDKIKGQRNAFEYTDEDRKQPWYRIFFDEYRIRIKQIDAYSQEHHDIFGHYGSEEHWANEEVTVRRTIVEMALMRKQGISFILVDYRKSSQIYDLIVAHISFWRDRLENSISRIAPPLDDLITLNDFACELVPMARQFLDTSKVNTGRGFLDLVTNIRNKYVEGRREYNPDFEHSDEDINMISHRMLTTPDMLTSFDNN